jgi:hypothetical protein
VRRKRNSGGLPGDRMLEMGTEVEKKLDDLRQREGNHSVQKHGNVHLCESLQELYLAQQGYRGGGAGSRQELDYEGLQVLNAKFAFCPERYA